MVFEDLFLESGGRPVEFKGRVVQLVDHFPLGPTGGVRLSFKAADSEYRQGVLLRLKRGSFFVNEIRTRGPSFSGTIQLRLLSRSSWRARTRASRCGMCGTPGME